MEVMTKIEAEQRRSQIADVTYQYDLRLFNSDEWTGEAVIKINATCDCLTWLDINVDKIVHANLND